MDDFIHHLIHFLMYSLVIWQIVLGVYVILIWAKKNIKFQKNQVFNVANSHDSTTEKVDYKETKKDLGPVEVDIKKDIFISDVDKSDLKTDTIVKGKVKTQKDKLKKLRNKT